MCQHDHAPAASRLPGRRGFLSAAAASALGLAGGGRAEADALTREQRDKMTPEEIIAVMKAGNVRFRRGENANRNYLAEQRASATAQFPAAAVLSCIDSRAPAEVVMDLGIGDVFNARVAGNVANGDILGSLEFATQVAGAKVILVMTHTACGAIKGAIDNVELGHLTALLARIKDAVKVTVYEGDRSSKNNAFVDAVARKNVELTIAYIRAQSSVLRDLEKQKKLQITGAKYDLATAAVEFFS